MNPAKNKQAEKFLTHVNYKNNELICKERNCCNPRAAKTMSSYCVMHRMRKRQWFTSERVGWPAGALRKYYGHAGSFITDNWNQKPIHEAIRLITELVNGNFSQFSPAQYDHVLQRELSKRHCLQDHPIKALERLLGFWLFFKDHPARLPQVELRTHKTSALLLQSVDSLL